MGEAELLEGCGEDFGGGRRWVECFVVTKREDRVVLEERMAAPSSSLWYTGVVLVVEVLGGRGLRFSGEGAE